MQTDKITLTLSELLAQHDALQLQLERAKSEEAARVLREIVRKMQEYGITLVELMGSTPIEPPAKTAESKLAKYRDPATGATWSGRGRAPRWINEQDRSAFQIAS
jgi:DNA-binding protein H-NS